MNAFKNAVLLLIIILLVNFNATAQKHRKNKRDSEKLSFNSIGIGIGLYKPYFDYWNNISYVKSWDTKLTSAPVYSLNFELQLFKIVNLRFEGQYWSGDASNFSNVLTTGYKSQELALRLIPITSILTFNISENEIVRTYLGFGAGLCIITNELTREYTSEKKPKSQEKATGSGYIYNLVEGFDIKLVKGLRLGIETRFTFGSYEQASTNSGINTVKLDGVQILTTLSYTFKTQAKTGRFHY